MNTAPIVDNRRQAVRSCVPLSCQGHSVTHSPFVLAPSSAMSGAVHVVQDPEQVLGFSIHGCTLRCKVSQRSDSGGCSLAKIAPRPTSPVTYLIIIREYKAKSGVIALESRDGGMK